jgi:hypothetical protein
MTATSPRLRPYRFAEDQPVLLGGDLPAVIRGRLRTFAGRALYQIELTGETAGRPFRTVMEDGLVEVTQRPAQARNYRAAVLSPRRPVLLLPQVPAAELRAAL